MVRSGNHLLIVDDSAMGVYFRVTLPEKPVPLMELNRMNPVRVPLRKSRLAVDLESIGLLADGRVALLSERLRSLVGIGGIIAEYDSQMSELAKRGLEGLAIRPLSNGDSRVAVLWEGGYPDYDSLPVALRRPEVRRALAPLVLIHDVKKQATAGRVRTSDAIASFELQMPVLEGEEPQAQRFRAPELIWHRLKGASGAETWGFIVLITSQNALPRPEYHHHWLQRFNLRGETVGDALELARLLPASLAGANWEGLCWFEEGRSVLLVHEADGQLPPHAFILTLPEDWRF